MKKILISIIFGMLSLNVLFAQIEIEDSNFEQALIDLGIDSNKTIDGKILIDDIKSITQLIIIDKNIESLKGIENFESLTSLYCSNNNLTTLDLSNENLTSLYCSNNNLTTLDISSENLTSLYCTNNKLTTLDLSNNLKLEKLDCSSNSITTINVFNNTNLKTFNFTSNQISSINLSTNSSLVSLKCSNNRLTNLLVNDNTKLEELFFTNNQIKDINVQNNILLRYLMCSSNQLKDLNLSKNDSLRLIDFSNNQLKTIDVTNNTFLTNISGSKNQLTELNLIKNDSLYFLNIANNQINSIGVSTNNNLENLICGSNQLDKLDVSEYPLLKTIDVSNNLISTIDLTKNNTITSINCSDNPIEILNAKNGNNSILSTFNATETPNLLCIQIDDTNAIGKYWMKDNQARYSEDCTIDQTNIPDANFEQALIDLGFDDVLDDYVLTSNIDTISTLDISGKNITDLTGINNFLNLLSFNCSNNNLTSISIPLNLLLTSLNCSNNNLIDLDVTANTNLSNLNCSDNLISTLNLKSNSLLIELDATNNSNLSCIEVKSKIKADTPPTDSIYTNWLKDALSIYSENCVHPLETYIPDNNFEQILIDKGLDTLLDSLVLTKNIDTVKVLNIENKAISDLTGLEDFIELDTLDCSNNSIRFLDVSNLPKLSSLNCSSNKTLSLTLYNVQNDTLEHFDATNNLLTCIKVKDSAAAVAKTNWFIDSSTLYSETDCIPDKTLIPDNNFEQALIDLGYDSGPLDSYVTTYNINTITNLDVNDKNIKDLTGIEDFIALDSLSCSENELSSIDISKNANLKKLSCYDNFLTGLNSENNILLTNLNCSNNNISTLNTSSNINLIELVCNANELTEINVSNNIELLHLNINSNHITSAGLDISDNTNLEELYCSNNKLSSIDIGSNTNLIEFKCSDNHLLDIDLTTNNLLEELDCSQNYLTNLNVDNNDNLNKLTSNNTKLTSLNIKNNTNLTFLSANENEISNIDLSANTLLSKLYLNYNSLTNIAINNNTNLEILSIVNNSINTIDLNANTLLENLYIGQNNLTTLNTSSNTFLKTVACSNNEIETLDFTNNTTLNSLRCYSNKLKTLVIQNSKNDILSSFNAIDNDDLFCIEVDDPDNISSSWQKDSTASYNLDCRYNETYIADTNFEQALIDLGFDKIGVQDNYVLTAHIETIETLDISNKTIENIIGIEDFKNLNYLNCSFNNIDSLDVSNNLNLTELICSNNNLDSLNVTSNSLLKVLNVSSNIITKLTISALAELETLDVNSNLLTSLNLNTNPNLISLNCSSNKLATLDLNTNTDLATLDCSNNSFTEIELNSLTSLASLNCSSNLLSTLIIKNGSNTNLLTFNATNNTNLFCIEVDDPTFSNNTAGWQKDTQAEYNEFCHYFQTYVPDNAFEQKIINLGLDSGSLDNYVPTANIKLVTSLSISNLGINDLTGIEDFIALTNLNCSNNQIISLEPNKLSKLTILNCSNNLLTGLNTTEIPNLKTLVCNTNKLTNLYINDNLELTTVDCSANSLTDLDISKIINLSELNCSNNQITSFDISENYNLTILDCSINQITNLNLQNKNNQLISSFDARNNPDLLCVLVDNIDASEQYNNWSTDYQSHYKLECNDDDNDGVPNTEDQCLNTPLGDFVDLFGCTIFTLPADNFNVFITDETCLSSNNGKVTINATKTLNYTAKIKGDGIENSYNFTNSSEIRNLKSGVYELCITIEDKPNYLNCYEIAIDEPKNLDVVSKVREKEEMVSLKMSGGKNYTINHNGLILNTKNNIIQLNLDKGKNNISVKTDLDCQGIYNETVFISINTLLYPNPFDEDFKIALGKDDSNEVSIKIYSYNGQLILSKPYPVQNGIVAIENLNLTSGFYFLTLESNNSYSTFKIIKK